MKSLPLIFLGIFFTLAFSWTGIVLTSHLQLEESDSMYPVTTTLVDDEGNEIAGPTYPDDSGRLVPGQVKENETLYPYDFTGAAKRGMRVYEALGCLYCHSQQVRRSGFGSDIARGWGRRQSVSRDYIFHDRVMLGTMRTGPDLSNVGTRYTELWQHQHLYSPQSVNAWSIMPSFAYLYEVRKIGSGGPSANAIEPLDSWGIPDGYEVLPSQEAEDLVAYLMALNQNYELPEMKFSE
ncbi:MAG: cbb3-type cytochrome c oxidase subunit II [Opitutales bacterium]